MFVSSTRSPAESFSRTAKSQPKLSSGPPAVVSSEETQPAVAAVALHPKSDKVNDAQHGSLSDEARSAEQALTALLAELAAREIRPDLILFADTGGEKPETYAYLPVIRRYLARVGFPSVTTVRYEPTRSPYRTLEGQCLHTGTLPSGSSRTWLRSATHFGFGCGFACFRSRASSPRR